MAILRILIFVVLLFEASNSFAAVGTIYVDTGGCNTGSTTQCSGSTDSSSASASGAGSTITCSATSGPAAAPGCIITGTGTAVGQLGSIAIDGSQALFVNCATNTNQKIFWINAVDNGTGAVGTTVTPTGCTAASSDWGIGGRYIYPSGATADVVVNALRAGDTLQFNNTPATKSTRTFVDAGSAGDSTLGRINVIGKAGVRPILQTTGSSSTLVMDQTGWSVSNLELQNNSNNSILNASAAVTISNMRISGTGVNASQNCITLSANGSTVQGSEIGPCGAIGINPQSSVAQALIFGNYIHNATSDGITSGSTSPGIAIVDNVISANGGRGIYFSGASTSFGSMSLVIGNTIYGNSNSGLEVADADLPLSFFNNIIQSTITTVATVKWAAGNGQNASIHGYNVFWNSADSNSGLSAVTANSTEFSSNPAMSNPGSADFSITSASPAAGTGYLGSLPIAGTSVGYRDIGAIQRAVGAGGGRIIGG